MNDLRKPECQHPFCGDNCGEEPRGFLTEWEATPLEPTEDAMQNDKAERLLNMLHESKAGRDVRNAVAALLRTQAARIAELEAANRGLVRLNEATQARAAAAKAEVARLRKAADRLEECSRYFATAFSGKNADKLLSAIAEYRAALQPKEEDV